VGGKVDVGSNVCVTVGAPVGVCPKVERGNRRRATAYRRFMVTAGVGTWQRMYVAIAIVEFANATMML
jgi:hypothetical protein